jgi:hypothetical protein
VDVPAALQLDRGLGLLDGERRGDRDHEFSGGDRRRDAIGRPRRHVPAAVAHTPSGGLAAAIVTIRDGEIPGSWAACAVSVPIRSAAAVTPVTGEGSRHPKAPVGQADQQDRINPCLFRRYSSGFASDFY